MIATWERKIFDRGTNGHAAERAGARATYDLIHGGDGSLLATALGVLDGWEVSTIGQVCGHFRDLWAGFVAAERALGFSDGEITTQLNGPHLRSVK